MRFQKWLPLPSEIFLLRPKSRRQCRRNFKVVLLASLFVLKELFKFSKNGFHHNFSLSVQLTEVAWLRWWRCWSGKHLTQVDSTVVLQSDAENIELLLVVVSYIEKNTTSFLMLVFQLIEI